MYTTYRSALLAHIRFIIAHTLIWVCAVSINLYFIFSAFQNPTDVYDLKYSLVPYLTAFLIVGTFIQCWLYARHHYQVYVEIRLDGTWCVLSDRQLKLRSYLDTSEIAEFSVFESYLENNQVLNQYIAKCMKSEGYV